MPNSCSQIACQSQSLILWNLIILRCGRCSIFDQEDKSSVQREVQAKTAPAMEKLNKLATSVNKQLLGDDSGLLFCSAVHAAC